MREPVCFCVNLNIVDAQPVWDMLEGLYASMPGWRGFERGCPQWRTEGGAIRGSVEPGGLQISGEMPEEEWSQWLALFKERAGEIMGYAIGEPAEGFDFRYYSE